jgi:ech hydrogenase subunit C
MAAITKSPWIIHYDGSSCNGCDIEVLACLTPMYDVERFGIINTGNPKHADVFLVTGSVNEQNIPVVKQIYDQMPNPKVVVAIGICATSGGIFRDCYNIIGGIDQVIPVDVYVPGCAARPEAIIDGVVKGLGVLAEKQAAMERGELIVPDVEGAYEGKAEAPAQAPAPEQAAPPAPPAEESPAADDATVLLAPQPEAGEEVESK